MDESELTESYSIMNNYKVSECVYNMNPNIQCPHGQFCHKYHNPNERRRNPFKRPYSPNKCSLSYNGEGCPQGEFCTFAHTELEVFYHPKVYKTILCEYFDPEAPNGKCGWGDLCSHAHGEDDLRTFEQNCEQNSGVTNDYGRVMLKLKELQLAQEGGCELKKCLSIDRLKLENLSMIETNKNESENLKNLREKLDSANKENLRLSAEHKRYYDELLKIVIRSTAKLGQNSNEFLKAEASRLESISLEKLRHYCDMARRLKCPNCPTGIRSFVLIPCGHSFCEECVSSAANSKDCFNCGENFELAQPFKQ